MNPNKSREDWKRKLFDGTFAKNEDEKLDEDDRHVLLRKIRNECKQRQKGIFL